jgi:hypothetical protein
MIRDEAAIALLAQFIDEDLIMYGDGSPGPQNVIRAGELPIESEEFDLDAPTPVQPAQERPGSG